MTKRASKVRAPARKPSAALATHRDAGRLFERVATILEEARARVARTVNSQMVLAYWNIGREIVEHLQGGGVRAGYGNQLVDDLSRRLSQRFGRGFSTTNLRYFRSFYLAYADRRPEIRHLRSGESDSSMTPNQIRHTRRGVLDDLSRAAKPTLRDFSSVLGWTHYRVLMNVEHDAARRFYEIEAERSRWSVEQLERQVHTQLFTRLLKSRDRAGVLDLASRGQVLEQAADIIRNPYVLDFLDLPQAHQLRESDLESAILEKLQYFLLELGKGFAFVARQKRLTFEDDHFYIDLVFYNVVLKCYLLIDLKLGKLTHGDVGQMDSYVRLYDEHNRTAGDGPTIGLILCAEKNEAVARYSVLHENRQLFAAKYLTWLPTVEELQRELARERRLLGQQGRTGAKRSPSSRGDPGRHGG